MARNEMMLGRMFELQKLRMGCCGKFYWQMARNGARLGRMFLISKTNGEWAVGEVFFIKFGL